MTKDVMVSVRGLQFEQGYDGENIEMIQCGEYYKRNDTHYVIYDEVTEGSKETTKNIIKFKEHEMNLTKRGFVNAHMAFEEKHKNLTNYVTPYGNILIGLEAKKISFTEEEKRILLNVDYVLDVNYEYLADCKIIMDIRARDGEGFSLQS